MATAGGRRDGGNDVEPQYYGVDSELRRSGSMPALRVVGFQPSLLRVSTLASAAQKAAHMEGLEYPQLSSPLSILLMADRRQNSDCSSGSSLFGCDRDSRHGEHSGEEERISNTGSSFDSIMNSTDSTASADGMQSTEKNFDGFEEGFVAAAPIDIPYNAHGVRHWRRQAHCRREREQRRDENWA